MKYTYLYIVLILIGIWGCTPKTTDKIVSKENTGSWRSMAPKSGEAKPVKMGKYSQETLSNGLRLIIVENHKLPLVNFQLSLDSPPFAEIEGRVNKSGYVGLSGSLMSTGTSSRTKSKIDQGVDNLGASLNTSGRSASGQCLTKHLDSFLDIFSDVIINPSFEQSEFDKAVKRTISGIQSNQDDPNSIARTVRNRMIFGDNHPFGRTASITSVNNITLEDVRNYHETTWFPKNTYLIIVGDITPEEAKSKAEKYFGNWSNPEAMPAYEPMPKTMAPKDRKVDFVNKAGAVQSVINIAYPINLRPGDDDAIAAQLMNAILGGGVFSSKLMQNLREDKAYTYGARSTLDVDPYQGYFNAFASVRNEVTDSSVVEFIKEMNVMRENFVNDENINIAKKFMTGTFARSLSNPSTVARLALNTAKYNLPADYYENYISNIQKVSKEDIMAMAKKYIRPDNAHVVVVGNKKEVAEKLQRFDGDQSIDYYDTEGNYIEPTDEKLPEGHTAELVISDYIDAIGGMSKLESINDVISTYKANLMGQNADFITIYKKPGMLIQEISSGAMLIQKSVFDGTVLKVSGMQGSQEITEGPEIETMKEEAAVAGQLNYSKEGYSIALDGIEKINGIPHYVILVKKPSGESSTEYYSKESALLTKVVSTVEVQGQSTTLTRELKDYKEDDGFKVPGTIVISGMMPTPVEMKLAEIKINSGVDETQFK